MPGKECYHCKQFIEDGQAHDCWTTTEAALTKGLPEDLRDAWARLRETASEFGDQRIYASHKSIMFSRNSCYCFVRPKQNHLELCVFLGREVKSAAIRRVEPSSKTKFVHTIRITHRDEVEAPVTDWMREAYEFTAAPPPKASAQSKRAVTPKFEPKARKGGLLCQKGIAAHPSKLIPSATRASDPPTPPAAPERNSRTALQLPTPRPRRST